MDAIEKLPPLVAHPIGVIHTKMRTKFDAPHQPTDGCEEQSEIELFPGHNFDSGLRDLEGFNRIWVLWWFHKNKSWRPLVLPPRGVGKRRGVFATRSPHRPNPIGMTAVPLISITGRRLLVGNSDLIDGTPILDIKPYITSVDSFPDASQGWIAEMESELLTSPSYTVVRSPLAEAQIEWLKSEYGISFIEKATETLSRFPEPHRTRRITRSGSSGFRMGCGAWRLFFSVNQRVVLIERIEPGYPIRLLKEDSLNDVPDRDSQLAFLESWKNGCK